MADFSESLEKAESDSFGRGNGREVTAVLKLVGHTARNIPGVVYHGDPAAAGFVPGHGVILETVGLLRSNSRQAIEDMQPICKCLTEGTLYVEGLVHTSFAKAACGGADVQMAPFDSAGSILSFHIQSVIPPLYRNPIYDSIGRCLTTVYSSSAERSFVLELKASLCSASLPHVFRRLESSTTKTPEIVNREIVNSASLPAAAISFAEPGFVPEHGVILETVGLLRSNSRKALQAIEDMQPICKCLTEGTLYVEGLVHTSFAKAACGGADVQMAHFDFASLVGSILSFNIQSLIPLYRNPIYDSTIGRCLRSFVLPRTKSEELKASLCSASLPHIFPRLESSTTKTREIVNTEMAHIMPFFTEPESVEYLEEEVSAPKVESSVSKADGYHSDEEGGTVDSKGINIKFPSRSAALAKLPEDIRNRLKENLICLIGEEAAQSVLGDDRFNFVLETEPNKETFHLSDYEGRLDLHFETNGPKEFPVTVEAIGNTLKIALGPIRDQEGHNICWAYVICDAISGCRVLNGLDEKFIPLSPMFLCRNADQERYKRLQNKPDRRHSCFGNSLIQGLCYAKKHGVRREKEGEEFFNCRNSDQFVGEEEELYKIKEIYRYESIEPALERVSSGYPVLAGLTLLKGWDKSRSEKIEENMTIYPGPESEKKQREGEHAVIMMAVKIIHGVKVVICKLSNGKRTGNQGYLAVNVEFMTSLVGAAVKKGFCRKKPRHLLYNFYSIDVEMGTHPLIKLDPDQAAKNMRFKVNTDAYLGISPKYQTTLRSPLRQVDVLEGDVKENGYEVVDAEEGNGNNEDGDGFDDEGGEEEEGSGGDAEGKETKKGPVSGPDGNSQLGDDDDDNHENGDDEDDGEEDEDGGEEEAEEEEEVEEDEEEEALQPPKKRKK